ncbi:MAG TPA: mannose-1-phosphate guanylyltransferase [Thermomicrobiales bacterium]|nr:mannose-1-phosphate guanylyltransferase [Thermomicrobiales bacterium]
MTRAFYATIPAGGSGTRLWPLSRADRPKFLLPLPGPRTMIQETVDRLCRVCPIERLSIITGRAHAAEIACQLPELSRDQIIVEPDARGSGPVIGLSAAIAHRRDPDAIVGSFASDHAVSQPEDFERAVRAAIELAEEDYLVTIGIQPGYAETGYGYIRAGDDIGVRQGLTVRKVASFREKPDLATAEEYVASGSYLWNSSMFVWKASALLAEMRCLLPQLAQSLDTIAADWDTPRGEATFHAVWPTIEDVSIDHGILERSQNVAVVPGSFGWTDLGDWHGLGRLLANSDGENIALARNVLFQDSQGAVVVGGERMIVVLGLDNVVVVDTDDAVLVCDRSQAQQVKDVVAQLRLRGSTRLI